MSTRRRQLRKRLKEERAPVRYPIGTLAAYGPDDRRASKLVASVIERRDAGPTYLQRWFCEEGDARSDPEITAEVVAFFAEHPVTVVVRADRIIGCPHEQDIDYEGDTCPECEFWATRDRWSGNVLH